NLFVVQASSLPMQAGSLHHKPMDAFRGAKGDNLACSRSHRWYTIDSLPPIFPSSEPSNMRNPLIQLLPACILSLVFVLPISAQEKVTELIVDPAIQLRGPQSVHTLL